MGLKEWFTEKIDDAADAVQSWTGEKARQQTVEDTKEVTEGIRSDVTNNVAVLNELASSFNERIDRLNELREKAIQELVGQLRQHMSRFGRVKDPNAFVPETYRRSYLSIPEKQLQTEEEYIANFDWDEDEVFNFTFNRTIFGTKKKTEEIVFELTEHLDKLRYFREELAREFDQKVDRRELEISIAQTYIEVIDVLIDQIENVILPKLSIIKNFMIAKHVALYEENLEESESNSVLYSADTLRGTKFEEYGVFIRNSFGFYILSANILANAVLTHLLDNSVTAEDEAELALQQSAVDDQVRALEGN